MAAKERRTVMVVAVNVLLVGPMTGDNKKDWLFFKYYEDRLRLAGLNVANPLRVIKEYKRRFGSEKKMPEMMVSDDGWRWFVDLKYIFEALLFCDVVFLMPGWNRATNSLIVDFMAQKLGMEAMFYRSDELCISKFHLAGMSGPAGAPKPPVDDADEQGTMTAYLPPEAFKKFPKNLSIEESDVVEKDGDEKKEEFDTMDGGKISTEDLGRETDIKPKPKPPQHPRDQILGKWFENEFKGRHI